MGFSVLGCPDSTPGLADWLGRACSSRSCRGAKVYAKASHDVNLIVLRSDGAGHVRVLFPLDPQGEQRITGGKKYELKGRGGREAFRGNCRIRFPVARKTALVTAGAVVGHSVGYRHDTITHARTIVTASSNSAITLSLTPRAFTRPVRAW